MRHPPAGFEREIRRRLDDPTLSVWFDLEEADKTGRSCWKVMSYLQGAWSCVVTWRDELDGNLEAVIHQIAAQDFTRNGGSKKLSEEIYNRAVQNRNEKRRRFRDWAHGFADYSRNVFRAMAYGEPSVGAR